MGSLGRLLDTQRKRLKVTGQEAVRAESRGQLLPGARGEQLGQSHVRYEEESLFSFCLPFPNNFSSAFLLFPASGQSQGQSYHEPRALEPLLGMQ